MALICLVTSTLALLERVPVRSRPICCVAAGAYSSGDWGREQDQSESESQPPRALNRWQRIGECDVLLPEDGTPCTGLVHFVGGALVGAAPAQAYGPFLEAIGAGGGTSLGIVATPVQGLTSLDHWAAASEVLLRWCAAKRELDTALFIRGDPHTDSLPVIGLGHSLGCKLLVLLGSDAKYADALGPRAANVLVSYNNYGASESIPLLEEASAFGSAAQSGRLADILGTAAASQATGALDTASRLGSVLGKGAASALQGLSEGLTGSVGGGQVAGSAAEVLEETSRQFAAFGRGASAAGARARAAKPASGTGGEGPAAEFTPGPIETDALILSSYRVGRNLLVRFADDDIDQTSSLARLLKTRFTDDITGIGGRLEFKKLDGTHVTPNAPAVVSYMEGFDWDLAAQMGVADMARGLEESATRTERERSTACEVIVQFAEREITRATAA